MIKRFLVVLAISMTLAIPAAAFIAEPEYVPIEQEAYVEDLRQAGYTNGSMPSIRMIDVNGCVLERDAAYTLSVMVEAARTDGIDLVPIDCYRSYDSQAAAYNRRCPIETEEITKVDPETGATVVVGTTKTRTCSGPPIAQAGRSNHGWGRAVDFGNGRRVFSCSDAAFSWLEENASRFGWVHPDWARCGSSTREPWHWEWGGVAEALLIITPPERSNAAADARYR